MRAAKSRSVFTIFCIVSGVVAARLPSAAQNLPGLSRGVFDARAQKLIQRMVETYAQLTVFEQETEYSAELTPVGAPATAVPEGKKQPSVPSPAVPTPKPDGTPGTALPPPLEQKSSHRARLLYAEPNRLRMEISEPGETEDRPQTSLWISDGKFFWSYNPAKNLYTKEKVPSRLREFGRLTYLNNGSMELMMLMGANPFANLVEQVDSLRYLGTESVRGVETDVISMESDAGTQKIEMRLYIGAEDHLLRRVVSESGPKAQAPKRGGVGSPLDDLAEEARPAPLPPQEGDVPQDSSPTPGPPMKSRLVYDNLISLSPRFNSQTFAYTPPDNAYSQTVPDPHRKPLTLKQRLAELVKSLKAAKNGPPRTIRF